MSRFFATGSDSESETSSSEDEGGLAPKAPIPTKQTYAWSDEEEDTKRVVRSAKDKRFDELTNIIALMKNHKNIKDMSKILTGFEDLGRAYDKAKKVIEKEGIPRFYIRALAELEDFVNECWEDRDGRKAMSKNNAKGLTTLRQKLRKYNRNFEKDLESYRENPDAGDAVEEEEDRDDDADSGDDGDGNDVDFFKKEATPVKKEAPVDDGSDSDDMDWGGDSDSESSSSDEELHGGNLTADMFRKKVVDETAEIEKQARREKRRADKKIRDALEPSDDETGDWTTVKGSGLVAEKPKIMFQKDAEINHELVLKKLMELISARGKKSTDRNVQIDMLRQLQEIAKLHKLGDAMDVKIQFSILSAIFDYNPNIATSMRADMWETCVKSVEDLLEALSRNGDNIMCSTNVSEDNEKFDEEGPWRVRGCVLTVIERMDEEYIKMLQACDAHSTEYVDRLKDEPRVCKVISDLQGYLEDRATTEEICRCYLKTIQHMCYKFDPISRKAALGLLEEGEVAPDPAVDPRKIMDRLCKFIYAKDNTDRIRTRAILSHIYHHAIHDRWFEARDLMLMSHLQDTIQHSDIPTQIMYNRGMVQLGLCAFRQGMIKDAHACLVDIQSSGRAKELLAQGLLLQRQNERTPEQEKIEKRRQMPYHMHINLELLECVYLVSAMLLEIPYMAAHEFDARRRLISKNFHHVLRVSERQPLVGPPESMREHVVAASKAMKNGDWKDCKTFLINDKMNAKVWDLFHQTDKVRNMIIAKVQEESLRTYLFTYSAVYDSLSMDTLAEMFEIERATVHSIISKMIINEELMASLDEPTQAVMMHRTEPTRLQSLALQLSEKVSALVDYNERFMEVKQGGSFFAYQRGGQGKRGDGNYHQRQGGDYHNKGGYNRDGQKNYNNRGGYQGRRGGGGRGGQGGGGYNRRGGYDNNRRGGYNNRYDSGRRDDY